MPRYLTSFTEAENAIQAWAASASGLEAIIANQDGPRPPEPFVTVQVRDVGAQGLPYRTPPREDGTAEIHEDRTIMASVQIFGTDALNLGNALRATLERQETRLTFLQDGITFVRAQPVADLTQVVGTGFEPRASLDIEWRAAFQVADVVGCITSVETAGDYGVKQTTNVTGV